MYHTCLDARYFNSLSNYLSFKYNYMVSDWLTDDCVIVISTLWCESADM